MNLRVNRADKIGIIIILIVIVAFGGLVGLATLENASSNPSGEFIALTYMTFSSASNTLNFTLDNPPLFINASITSVSVDQNSCDGVFLPLQVGYTNESCIISGNQTFASGQSVNYDIKYSNGQSVSGSLIAQ